MKLNKQNVSKDYILLVDDEESLRITYAEFLRADGWNVKTASNAEEALELMGEKAPDLLICDLILPGNNGDYIISEMRRNFDSNIKIIVITGLPEDKSEKMLFEKFSINEYHPKPFNKNELLKSVNRLLNSN